MYETYVPMAETIEERKPPTIADIVREKTDDGARIIDFFLDVMEGRVDGAKLCHRIDAAKQLVKFCSKDAANFIAEHRDVTCDHCESRRRGPRSRKDTSPAAGPLHASVPFTYDFLPLLTEDFLTVLSAVDEDLMIKLVRAQTAHGDTVVEFLDDVMKNTVDGFKPHHRIAAAKELISHILRDEEPEAVLCNAPSPVRAEAPASVSAETPEPPSSLHSEPTSLEPVLSADEASAYSVPVEGSQPETNNSKLETLPVRRTQRRHTRKHRRQTGNARTDALRRVPASQRNEQEHDKSASVELTAVEHSFKERNQLRHEPDPRGAPIDATSPGRSPP